MHIFDPHSLQQELDRRFSFWRMQKNGPSDRDVPEGLAKRILGLRNTRRLKQLKAVLTAPVLRLDGSLLSQPGYDDQTGAYLCGFEGWEAFSVLERVSKADVKASLDRLMAPFGEFPYAAAVDRSAHLTALLTAVCRPMLPTAPAFGYDAPVQGSGKTLLARCTGALATSGEPAMMPMSKTMDDEEIRKRTLAMLRQGVSVMVWDNVLGQFKSPVTAMLLTSATYTDRILCKTESATFDMRSMLILTGNNLCMVDDMVRRVLVCGIDPKEEQPFNRRFEHDPFLQV